MPTVKENLIAARAHIDTPEKLEANGIIDALLVDGTSIAMFNQMRRALLRETDGATDRIAAWRLDKSHAEVMAVFDRAIAAQDGVS